MLSLSRYPGESVTLFTENGVITVLIGRPNGKQVKVVVDAPKSVKILRSELLTENPLEENLK